MTTMTTMKTDSIPPLSASQARRRKTATIKAS
jgi:hypothetical protein